MSDTFDPYHRWLGIAPDEQPADHYRLLGLKQFEDDADVIESAADRQMAHVRGFQSGPHADDAQRVLNEIAAARLVLLKADEKSVYDARLRAKIERAERQQNEKQQREQEKREQEQKILRAQPLPAAAPPPAASPPPPVASAEAAPQEVASAPLYESPQPVIHVRRRRKSSSNAALLGGAAVLAVLLLIGGAIAMLARPWELGDALARHSNGDQPPTVETPPEPPDKVSTGHTEDGASDYGGKVVGENPLDNPAGGGTTEEPGENSSANGNTDNHNGENEHGENDGQPNEVDPEPPPVEVNVKTPVPDTAAREAAQARIAAIFHPGQADTPAQKAELAQQLLDTARETQGDPVSLFVLLNLARETAAAAGQMPLASQAIDRLEATFDFDVTPVRLATLGAVLDAKVPPETKHEALPAGVALIDQLFERDEYEKVDKLALSLLEIARRTRDTQAINALAARRRRADELLDAYHRVRAALETLKTDPDNADANLAAGRYYLLTKNDWGRALPLLAKGSDEQLAAAAQAELAQPTTTADQEKLADAWWTAAESQNDIAAKNVCLAQAHYWYCGIVDQLTGFSKASVKRRIEAARDIPLAALVWPRNQIEIVYLDDLSESAFDVGIGQLGKHGFTGYPGDDRQRLPFNNEFPAHALSMHAKKRGTAIVTYHLAKEYRSFHAIAGLLGSLNEGQAPAATPVTFKVVGDDKVLWKSHPMRQHGAGEECEVDVSNVETLTLAVDCPGDHTHAWTAWLNPRLTHIKSAANSRTSVAPPDRRTSKLPDNLLDLIDVKQHTLSNTWERREKAVVSPASEAALLMAPLEIAGSYEVAVEFTRHAGKKIVGLVLPVGQTQCSVLLSCREGQSAGIENIDGKWLEDNGTKRSPSHLVNGQRYELHCRVVVRGEAAAIEVWVNGAPLTAWSGPVAALSDITVRTALRRRHLGLYSWNAPTTFHSLRLRMLEGKATPDGDAVVADKASVE